MPNSPEFELACRCELHPTVIAAIRIMNRLCTFMFRQGPAFCKYSLPHPTKIIKGNCLHSRVGSKYLLNNPEIRSPTYLLQLNPTGAQTNPIKIKFGAYDYTFLNWCRTYSPFRSRRSGHVLPPRRSIKHLPTLLISCKENFHRFS